MSDTKPHFISRELLEEAIEWLSELSGEWKWKEKESRCGYSAQYKALGDCISKLNDIHNK